MRLFDMPWTVLPCGRLVIWVAQRGGRCLDLMVVQEMRHRGGRNCRDRVDDRLPDLHRQRSSAPCSFQGRRQYETPLLCIMDFF
jgi:hypothetical protein